MNDRNCCHCYSLRQCFQWIRTKEKKKKECSISKSHSYNMLAEYTKQIYFFSFVYFTSQFNFIIVVTHGFCSKDEMHFESRSFFLWEFHVFIYHQPRALFFFTYSGSRIALGHISVSIRSSLLFCSCQSMQTKNTKIKNKHNERHWFWRI